MPDPIDLERLRQLSDGTPAGVEQLAQMFVTHITETAGELRAAVDGGRGPEIRAVAHRGAGTAGACGARSLAATLAALEAAGRDGPIDDAPRLMAEAEAEIDRVRQFLSAFTARSPR